MKTFKTRSRAIGYAMMMNKADHENNWVIANGPNDDFVVMTLKDASENELCYEWFAK